MAGGAAECLEDEAIGADDIADVAEVETNVDVACRDRWIAVPPRGYDPPRRRRNDEVRPLAGTGVVERPHDDDRGTACRD